VSELGLFGLPPPPPPPVPRPAASVILWRPGPRGLDLYLVRRGATQRFAPGFTAFPGGRRDAEDAAVPVHAPGPNAPADLACAARELFEEAGVLVVTGRPRPSRELTGLRTRLLAGGVAFTELLGELGAEVDGSRFVEAGRWVTPEFYAARFDAVTYLVEWREGDDPEVWPGELEDGDWLPAASALDAWSRGERLFLPPNLWPVRVLARGPSPDLEALRHPDRSAFRIEYQQGVWQLPLRTPTLPPATHTNCWILDLGNRVAVVDPGSPLPEEQARLDRFLDTLAAEGRPARELWLTHGHLDHVGGVAALAARGLTIRAHRAIAPRLPGLLFKPLREGELLGGRYGVLFTPGHARDHVVFQDEETGSLLVGDMLSTLSTVVIDPPEGDMAEYERQLERLIALEPGTLYPAHGQPVAGGAAALRAYLDHRAEREARIVAALRSPGPLAEVTARAYADVAPEIWPVAQRSALAVLLKLAAQGRAVERDGRWQLSPPASA
jgi:glyoxylase-like metal-dependent hydrolase (beta-lactamase superfamily II)/8-oxo-dGTP pyrophosphatase MutT (NUDIX family)